MQLEKIKLAGFKSFCDHTVIPLQSKRTTIVGPNGCGKSNIIDAVRWVMGESSAKQLRGEAMADVIFNGTSNRKPVGQASIELIFDNTNTTLTGEYAKYNEISIRREINRDGGSQYYLNNTKCRRKDIIEVFLGTGLGPNSYAIIEQGIISQLIDAKPEELRIYLEEAAGISRYKERRRETENRIQHTRDNLARLTDVRTELEKQLEHLQRQAKAANRYQELKQQQRLTKAQLQAINWLTVNDQIEIFTNTAHSQETELEAKLAEISKINTEIETLRQQQITAGDDLGTIQKSYYSLGTDISKTEQQIQYHKERCIALSQDLSQLNNAQQTSQRDIDQDQHKIHQLHTATNDLEPQLAQAKVNAAQAAEEFNSAEQAFSSWQAVWEECNTKAADSSRQFELAQNTINHLQHQITNEQQRLDKLQQEQEQLNATNELVTEISTLQDSYTAVKTQHEELSDELATKRQKISEQKMSAEQLTGELNDLNQNLQQSKGRHASLTALQQAALQNNDGKFKSWLEHSNLADKPRLLNKMQVASGWEKAVEAVFTSHLEAVCVNNINDFQGALQQLTSGNIGLFENQHQEENIQASQPTLADKVESSLPIKQLLSYIYIADSLSQALEIRRKLKPYESVVTADGAWLGNSWAKLNLGQDVKKGMLQRQREIQELDQKIQTLSKQISDTEQASKQAKAILFDLDEQYQQAQHTLNELGIKQRTIYGDLKAKQTKLEHLQQRAKLLQQEINELQHKQTIYAQQLTASQSSLQELQQNKEQAHNLRTKLLAERDQYQLALEQSRNKVQQTNNNVTELLKQQELSANQIQYLTQNLARAEKQFGALKERREQLQQALHENEAPLAELDQKLQAYLQNRIEIENELIAARQKAAAIDDETQKHSQQISQLQETAQKIREQLEQSRIEIKALQVRGVNYQEQVKELGFDFNEITANLPENTTLTSMEEQLEQISKRIERLGPINLAAIDEHQQKEQRKNYLDAQNNDLVEALSTLENAIRKIDQETKEKFKQTFDQVNNEFQRLFPIIFGGGRAALTLTDNDLLSTGVMITAQPPGKRNTTIHLLSGGEKALTAIALVFGIFKLNPAPFCMLDEVDAPLDDHNVYRFCNLVKEMSNSIQFIIVSHNKTTMEMAEQLIGITMHEPGVSRMVSVDIEEAVKMAQA